MSHLLDNLLLFARLLRSLGFEVPPARLALLAQALGHLDLGRRAEVKAGARAVLASRREQAELFDRAFDLFFLASRGAGRQPIEMGRIAARVTRRNQQALASELRGATSPGLPEGQEEAGLGARRAASEVERLRRKDFAALTPEEEAAVKGLIRELSFPLAVRRTRRLQPSAAGTRFDLRATVRRSLRYGGELAELARRRRKEKARPLVVLCDVSGSMEPYSRMLLELLYVLGRGGLARGSRRSSARGPGNSGQGRREVFAFGTRLTSITRQLRHQRAERALQEATAAVMDWGGGTRIGASLARFHRDWARRVLGQGAVVLVISDGWERGEPELLEREVARLARSCARLIWLTPLLGLPGYEPLTRGIQAVLPWVDDFLPVHNLESLEALGKVLADLPRRRA